MKPMNIIVLGCGRVGAELAFRLFRQGHKVAVIDHTAAAFENLHPDFRGRTIEGEVLNQGVLEQAGIQEADGLAAVTTSDTLNAVVGHIALTVYDLPNVIARNYDSRFRPLLESFGLQVVSSSSWGAQRIEELLYHQEMRTVFSAGNGEVEIYEFTIPETWDGHALEELLPEDSCVVVSLTRAGRAILPDCKIKLKQGDIILVSATMEGIRELRRQLFQVEA